MEDIIIGDIQKNKISETVIIQRILSGERELYEILVRRNNQKLYRVIRSYINDSAEIEDLMQNTYMKAYEKLFQFQQNAQFSTWLIRIGINETLARIKEKNKIYRLNDFYIDSSKISHMQDPNQNPEKQLIGQEARLLLEHSIDALDAKYKTIYILRVVEGMSIQEIADCLEISISNVKVRLHRSKAMLKEKLYKVTTEQEIFEFGFSKCDRLTGNVMRWINSVGID